MNIELEPVNLTRANIKNLKKLADYLETLPYRYRHFDMLEFIDEDLATSERIEDYARNNGGVDNCGTVACAVGHGPAAGVLFRNQDFERVVTFEVFEGKRIETVEPSWSSYAQRFISSDQHTAFEWCFGSQWVGTDNHHYGAAARIRYMLEHRAVPEGFDSTEATRKHRSLYQEFRKPSRS